MMLASGLNEMDYETFLAEEADMSTGAPHKEPARPPDVDEVMLLAENTPRVNLKRLRLKLERRAKEMRSIAGKPRKNNKQKSNAKASFKRIRRWAKRAKDGVKELRAAKSAAKPVKKGPQRTSTTARANPAARAQALPAPSSIEPIPDPKEMKLPSYVDKEKFLAAIAHYEV